MCNIKQYNITFNLSELDIDDEMNINIGKIMNVTGWSEEQVLNYVICYGAPKHLKERLKYIVDTELKQKIELQEVDYSI